MAALKICPTHGVAMTFESAHGDARLNGMDHYWACPAGDQYMATREDWGGSEPDERRLTL